MTPLPPGFFDRPVAHRALHDRARGRPENSRAAVRAAVDSGYGVEIDVQMSADGAAMVFHDDALDRLTAETGPVRARSAAELARIHLKDAADGIPPLAEVLALVGGRVPLVIEIKDQDGALGPDVGALEEAVARDVAGYAGPLAVMSFNPHSVARMADLAPDLPRGLTTCAFDDADWPLSDDRRTWLAAIADFDGVGAAFISHDHRALGMPRVAELKARGVPVLCWTIRSPAEEAAARRIADQITFEGYAAAAAS